MANAAQASSPLGIELPANKITGANAGQASSVCQWGQAGPPGRLYIKRAAHLAFFYSDLYDLSYYETDSG